MGPTGTPTEIPEDSAVLLAGGGLGNAVLFSIAKALKAQGNRVLYFAGYKNGARPLQARRDRSRHRPGDLGHRHGRSRSSRSGRRTRTSAATSCRRWSRTPKGSWGRRRVKLSDVTRIIAIGSDRMMNAVRLARHGALQPHLNPRHVGIGSINSPMQCMMKEVCAQCLQRHVDPETGKRGVHLLLLQPGPGARSRRLQQPAGAPAAEQRAGKTVEPVVRAPARSG